MNRKELELTVEKSFEATTFEQVKKGFQTLEETQIEDLIRRSKILLQKAEVTGQKFLLEKLGMLTEYAPKFHKALQEGFTDFVYASDVINFINNSEREGVKDSHLKTVELSRFPRDIPDVTVEKLIKAKGIFDEFYVIFTDYVIKADTPTQRKNGADKHTKPVERDPILFGTFKRDRVALDHWFVIDSWIDNHCDLTIEKLVASSDVTINQLSDTVITYLDENVRNVKPKENKNKELTFISTSTS